MFNLHSKAAYPVGYAAFSFLGALLLYVTFICDTIHLPETFFKKRGMP